MFKMKFLYIASLILFWRPNLSSCILSLGEVSDLKKTPISKIHGDLLVATVRLLVDL